MTVRDDLLVYLDLPRCARELRERTGHKRKAVETALARMLARGLVRCVTPNRRQSRLYALTFVGRLLRLEVTGEETLDPPDLPWDLYAWIQAGTYRRLVLRHLIHPTTSKYLRKSILGRHSRLGANHVHTVLREFARRDLARRTDGVWSLTTLGKRFHEIDRAGLVERPVIRASLWS